MIDELDCHAGSAREPVLEVTPTLLSAAATVDRAGTAVPDGVFEAMDAPLPATFKPTS